MILNKYFKIYNQIIDKAIYENRRKNNQSIYYENHHIVPRSIRPDLEKDKNNQVLLTAREHYLCHYLLTKFTENENKSKMVYAFNIMNTNCNDKKYFNSKLYESNKIEFSKNMKKRHKELGHPMKGKQHTEETKEKMRGPRPSLQGKNNPMYGKPAANRGKKHSKKTIQKMRDAKVGVYRGKENPNASIIEIYDNHNILQFKCIGNFKKVCEENNLPKDAFINSYKNNGTPIHLKPNVINKAIKIKIKVCTGWYALKK